MEKERSDTPSTTSPFAFRGVASVARSVSYLLGGLPPCPQQLPTTNRCIYRILLVSLGHCQKTRPSRPKPQFLPNFTLLEENVRGHLRLPLHLSNFGNDVSLGWRTRNSLHSTFTNGQPAQVQLFDQFDCNLTTRLILSFSRSLLRPPLPTSTLPRH